jgi:hypothetical protein
MFRLLNILLVSVVCLSAGCASPMELSRTIWGSSTRDLEEARVNGIVKIYDAPPGRCYDEALKAAVESDFKIFIQNKAKATIVVMGVKGSVNTTEVGIFCTEVSDNKSKIYISSLSSNAKRIVAEKILFMIDSVLGSSDSQTVTVINEQ